MNAAGMPPRGAAGATASCISDHLPRITTSAINDNGAETKKNPRLPYGFIIKPPKNGSDKYSIKEIQLLGSKFTKNDLVPAIVKSDFGPLQRTLLGIWKELRSYTNHYHPKNNQKSTH